MTRITVRPEAADQPDVVDLMRLSDQVAAKLYPSNGRLPFDVKTMVSENIVVMVARADNGLVAGCCSLFCAGTKTVELKRMIVDPDHRNLGVGKSLVASACDFAKRKGIKLMQLEVGSKNSAAQAIYEGAGFIDRGPFASHKASQMSRFMELALG